MRAAATHDGGQNDPASSLATNWERVDHAQSTEVETWYYSLVARYVPALGPTPPRQAGSGVRRLKMSRSSTRASLRTSAVPAGHRLRMP